jgi:hypothetical protein
MRWAPVSELPVLEVLSATHIIADLTLGLGKVVNEQPLNRSFCDAPREQGYSRGRYGRAEALA